MMPTTSSSRRAIVRDGVALVTVAGIALVVVYAAAQSSASESAREGWQRVPAIFEALEISEGSRVADIGAGGGFFTVRLAECVGPTGRVFAVDVSEKVVGDLRRRLEDAKLTQAEVIHGAPDDPKLPEASLDAVLMVNAYHEMRQYEAMLASIRRALKPGGRLVLVEPMKDGFRGTRREQQDKHILDPNLAESDLRAAGFEIIKRRDVFVERPKDEPEWLLVARNPASSTP